MLCISCICVYYILTKGVHNKLKTIINLVIAWLKEYISHSMLYEIIFSQKLQLHINTTEQSCKPHKTFL